MQCFLNKGEIGINLLFLLNKSKCIIFWKIRILLLYVQVHNWNMYFTKLSGFVMCFFLTRLIVYLGFIVLMTYSMIGFTLWFRKPPFDYNTESASLRQVRSM